jgi:hypothetical protein
MARTLRSHQHLHHRGFKSPGAIQRLASSQELPPGSVKDVIAYERFVR